VQSSLHRRGGGECRIAFLREIEARHITCRRVRGAGSFESRCCADPRKTRRYTAIVAAGLVVDGGIYRMSSSPTP